MRNFHTFCVFDIAFWTYFARRLWIFFNFFMYSLSLLVYWTCFLSSINFKSTQFYCFLIGWVDMTQNKQKSVIQEICPLGYRHTELSLVLLLTPTIFICTFYVAVYSLRRYQWLDNQEGTLILLIVYSKSWQFESIGYLSMNEFLIKKIRVCDQEYQCSVQLIAKVAALINSVWHFLTQTTELGKCYFKRASKGLSKRNLTCWDILKGRKRHTGTESVLSEIFDLLAS